MIYPVNNSTKSLTGRLAIFFTLVSCIICAITYIIFFNALKWAEDEVGEKRIVLDANVAISRYQAGEQGKLKIDFLTNAYDDISLVPKEYLRGLYDKNSFIGEIEGDNDSERMLYITQYKIDGIKKTLIMLSKIDEIELNPHEFIHSIALILGIFALLLTTFTLILMRLSKSLISPINELSQQLQHNKGESNRAFLIDKGATVEFAQFTAQLNHYRAETNALIKREQIFARYASHELRTPLTIIKGANDLLRKGKHSDFQLRQLARIKRASTQMTIMIDALLGLVRYEHSSYQEPQRTITEAELQAIIDDHHPHSTEAKNRIVLAITDEPQIAASTAIISIIVGNLIRNALSATIDGKLTVLLDSDSITVLDEGTGLSEQPFEEGHGLGLLLVDDICDRFGWHFTLANRDQKGCIAKVIFNK